MPSYKRKQFQDGDSVRPGDIPNEDQLIPKANLFWYGAKDLIERLKAQGIMTPNRLLKTYPSHEEHIRDVYGTYIDGVSKGNAVPVFFSRIPETLDNTRSFIEKNSPVRILIPKLLRSKKKFKILAAMPNNPDKLIIITEERLAKLTIKEDVWYKFFERSKDPYFRDVPQALIFSSEGIIPPFACKILKVGK